MARLVRVSPVGVPQSIVQRGNNRQVCFGGEEDMKAYLNWPKADRRQTTRREGERRDDIQETQHSIRFTADYTSDLLSKEEKLYFNQLFMNDSEK